MSTKSLLTKEEIVMLRTKHLQAVYKEYRDIVELLNLVTDKLKTIDGSDVYVGDDDQRRFLREIGRNVLELEGAVRELKLYLRDTAARLKIA